MSQALRLSGRLPRGSCGCKMPAMAHDRSTVTTPQSPPVGPSLCLSDTDKEGRICPPQLSPPRAASALASLPAAAGPWSRPATVTLAASAPSNSRRTGEPARATRSQPRYLLPLGEGTVSGRGLSRPRSDHCHLPCDPHEHHHQPSRHICRDDSNRGPRAARPGSSRHGRDRWPHQLGGPLHRGLDEQHVPSDREANERHARRHGGGDDYGPVGHWRPAPSSSKASCRSPAMCLSALAWARRSWMGRT